MALQRDSNKHGPLVDDQLKHEAEPFVRGAPVESRVEEYRLVEPGADDEPIADVTVRSDGLAPDPVRARAELSAQLGPSAFPADRSRLIAVAREHNAIETTVELLEQLPEGIVFSTVAEAWEALPVPSIEDIESDRSRVE